MKRFFAVVAMILLSGFCRADEGMWLPSLLQATVMEDMQQNGLKLSAEDIYSINRSSLKDAVLLYGSGCTGEVISGEGLLLTNHHCALGRIQSLSTVEKNYLSNGFWAMNRQEELACSGLTVTFIISMDDVTESMLKVLPADVPEKRRSQLVDSMSAVLIAEATAGTHYGAVVRSFYYGNQYFRILTETFRDIRLVGAPPLQIGNFGGDEDNWMWPRHTGDFSLFRIYAGNDNLPADYSPENVPFKPRHFFPISLNGVKEGDFTMVFGFPGATSEYLSSYGVELVQLVSDPLKVSIRDVRLEVWWRRMMENDTIRIQYTSKYNGLSNTWKKWKGEMRGLQRAGAISKKQQYEAVFTERIRQQEGWKAAYANLLPELRSSYDSVRSLQPVVDNYNEALMAPEIFQIGQLFKPLVEAADNTALSEEELNTQLEKTTRQYTAFMKNYSPATDREMLAAMLDLYLRNAGAERTPPEMLEVITKNSGNAESISTWLFQESMLDNLSAVSKFLVAFRRGDVKKLKKDPAYILGTSLKRYYDQVILPPHQQWSSRIQLLNRRYMKAQMEVFPEKKFYPDANLTLRLTHGKVAGYKARDAVQYRYFTTLDGMLEKYMPGHEHYNAPQKLVDLQLARDYGRFADADGTLHTAFIASNHTTGGNSGSPVLDAHGNLIGTNFDRCWEGTMSDYYYDVEFCRNISVDIRYTLFIIDKFAGAGYLLNEMKLVGGG